MIRNIKEGFLHHLILGNKEYSKSSTVYKRAILTGYLSLIVTGICAFHFFYDVYLNVFENLKYYLVLTGFAFFSFALNRYGRIEIAKLFLLTSTLFIVALFSVLEPFDSGNYFNFIPLIIAAFALFDFRTLHKGILFVIVTIVVFFIVYLQKFPIIHERIVTEEFIMYNFLIHFLISIITSILIIVFLIKVNQTIEVNLRKNEESLSQTTEELKASKIRFELALRGSNAGIYDWNIEENTIYHSPIWKNMLGYEADELENFKISDFLDLIHPEDLNRIKLTLDNHLENGSTYSEELRLKTKSGEYKWFVDSGQAVWNEEWQPIRMVGSIVNIHEKKKAEERIKRQNRMLEKANLELDKFVYSASHDLRSPLTSILGLINIAKQSKDGNEIRHCLDLMVTRVDKLDEIIVEIIDFSKNSKTGISIEKIDLHKLFKEVIENHQFFTKYDKVKVNLLIEPEFFIFSDLYRLKIVIKNLLSNAFKFYNDKNPKPWIIIEAVIEDNIVKIAIEDNGEGIKKEDQDKIFNMFYRASEKSKGSGLGLYIAKEIVEKLDGNISVQSIYGHGSRFVVEFPLMTPDEEEKEEMPSEKKIETQP